MGLVAAESYLTGMVCNQGSFNHTETRTLIPVRTRSPIEVLIDFGVLQSD